MIGLVSFHCVCALFSVISKAVESTSAEYIQVQFQGQIYGVNADWSEKKSAVVGCREYV